MSRWMLRFGVDGGEGVLLSIYSRLGDGKGVQVMFRGDYVVQWITWVRGLEQPVGGRSGSVFWSKRRSLAFSKSLSCKR